MERGKKDILNKKLESFSIDSKLEQGQVANFLPSNNLSRYSLKEVLQEFLSNTINELEPEAVLASLSLPSSVSKDTLEINSEFVFLKNGSAFWSKKSLDFSKIFLRNFVKQVFRYFSFSDKNVFLLKLSDLEELNFQYDIIHLLKKSGFSSVLVMMIRKDTVVSGLTVCLFEKDKVEIREESLVSPYLRKRLDQLFFTSLLFLQEGKLIAESSSSNNVGDVIGHGYAELLEKARILVFRLDLDYKISSAPDSSLHILGIRPEEYIERLNLNFVDFLQLEDRLKVEKLLTDSDLASAPNDLEFEARVVNRITQKVSWFLFRFIPRISENDKFIFYDCCGLDISRRKRAENELKSQTAKIKALYLVSSSIRGYVDTENVAIKGLIALCDATEGEAGLCHLYRNNDLKLVAKHGFGTTFSQIISQNDEVDQSFNSLFYQVAETRQPMVIGNLLLNSIKSDYLIYEEGFRSALIVPIMSEDRILGTVSLFSKKENAFGGGDVMLITAAASQIGLASKQASVFEAYKKQASNLKVHYRLSSELSRHLSLEDMFYGAFSIIQQELGLKRLWLGLVNETGTRLIGQAAFGAGWKKKLVQLNLALGSNDHPITKVVTECKPRIVQNAHDIFSEYGVRRVFSHLGIRNLLFVPMVSGGKVLGVLAVEAIEMDLDLQRDRIELISSLANDIANMVLTKKLETRLAEADKLRTAGLLASGIAHNFNNLLQAILGQASLLEMQAGDNQRIKRGTKIISESANKGAALVKQLLSFANLQEPARSYCDVNELIKNNLNVLVSQLGDEQEIFLNLSDKIPKAFVDSGQLLSIILALLKNANEAMTTKGVVEIFTDTLDVTKVTSHYEVPYGKYVRIGVRDSGRGMDEETRQRCFEPFFTTKNVDQISGLNIKGAGLGLSAAYALARKNGGRLVVESRPGKGSLFTIFVPVGDMSYGVDLDALSLEPESKIPKIGLLKVEKLITEDNQESAEKAENKFPLKSVNLKNFA